MHAVHYYTARNLQRYTGVLIWENENPFEETKFLKKPANFNEIAKESSEEECVGQTSDKNESRVMKIACSAKSSGTICKKKGINSKKLSIVES